MAISQPVRRHSNNKGRQMAKSGSRAKRTEKLAKKMGVKFIVGKEPKTDWGKHVDN